MRLRPGAGNRKAARYNIEVSRVQGKPVGVPEPVVTGFYSDDESKLYGAPVGLAQDNDGALLIANDVGDAVWLVTAASP